MFSALPPPPICRACCRANAGQSPSAVPSFPPAPLLLLALFVSWCCFWTRFPSLSSVSFCFLLLLRRRRKGGGLGALAPPLSACACVPCCYRTTRSSQQQQQPFSPPPALQRMKGWRRQTETHARTHQRGSGTAAVEPAAHSQEQRMRAEGRCRGRRCRSAAALRRPRRPLAGI